MDMIRAGVDDLGALIFVLYIIISIFQALFKKPKPGDEAGGEAPEPIKWDEEVRYDAQGRPVPSSKQGPGETESPPVRDPYGVLTGEQYKPPPLPGPEPRQKAPSRPRRMESPARSAPAPKAPESRRKGPPVSVETRPTESEHTYRVPRPEIQKQEWSEVFSRPGESDPQSELVRRRAKFRKAKEEHSAKASGKSAEIRVNAPAQDILRTLASPGSAATAILASEILGPPLALRRVRRRRF